MIKKASLLIFFLLIFYENSYPVPENIQFIVGSEEGEGQLIFPRQIKEGPDGNIYAYDESDGFIKVYSSNGKYLRRIGGKGQGPGEIQRADGANFGFTPDGKLYFTESFGGHKWITFMELSGEYHKVQHIEINEVFGILNSFPLKDGGFLVEFWLGSRPEMKKDYFLYHYPQSLVRIDAEGRIVSELVKTNYIKTISIADSGADQWIPFFPAFAWIPLKENMVVFADGLSRNLKVYDYNGILIREIKTALPKPQRVTRKDLDEWRRLRKEAVRDESWWSRFGGVVKKYKKSIYDKKPILSGIYSTPDGNILISSPWSEEEGMNYWFLDENGKMLAEIRLADEMLRISKHFIFVRATDEDGNYLVKCLKRIGTEREDLLKIKKLNIKKKIHITNSLLLTKAGIHKGRLVPK